MEEICYKVASTAIIHELLDNEVIIANLDTGVYYSIRESGVMVWQLLTSGYSLPFITTCLNEKFNIQSQISAFVDELLKENLILPVESENKNSLDALAVSLFWPAEFQKPILEKYEEMKNLLMLDPIHEVDEQGWPNKSIVNQ